jgi:formamidopyrimidine-DNA glycosylase
MPEITEAERLSRQLDQAWRGRQLKYLSAVRGNDGRIIAAKYVKNHPPGFLSSLLVGATIWQVSRLGKQILINFKTIEGTEYYWLQHLGHTGWWLPHDDLARALTQVAPIHSYFIHSLPESSIRMFLIFEDVGVHAFYDPRTFSRSSVYTPKQLAEVAKTFGPDWLMQRFNAAEAVLERLRSKPQHKLKSVLLDQRVAAGLGNYLVCEAAWRAKIHPLRLVGEVPDAKRQALLYHFLPNFIGESLFSNDHSHWGVFQHKDSLCAQCGVGRISYMKDSKRATEQRGTYFCPVCQPIDTDDPTPQT